MNIFAIFILGLFVGWLVEWVIDLVYWRHRLREVEEENARLRQRLISLETRPPARPGSAQKKARRDNLQAIKGVGPVIAGRLNEAGVTTFEELAALTPRQLRRILGELIKRFFPSEDKMIAQAKELAKQKRVKG